MAKDGRQYITVSVGGLEEGVDSKLVEPGSTSIAQNVIQTVSGEFRKRFGSDPLSSNIIGGGTLKNELDAASSIFSFNNTFCTLNRNTMYSYCEDGDIWANIGFCPRIKVSATKITSNVIAESTNWRFDCGVLGDIAVHTSRPITVNKKAIVTELSTGAVLFNGDITDAVPNTMYPSFCVPLSGSDRIGILCDDTPTGVPDFYAYFDTSTYTMSTAVDMSLSGGANSANHGCSAVAYNTTSFCFAYSDAADFFVERLDEDGAVTHTYQEVGYRPTVVHLVSDGTKLYVFAFDGANGTRVKILNDDMTQSVAWGVIDATVAPTTLSIVAARDNYLTGEGVRFFYEVDGAASARYLRYIKSGTVTRAGTIAGLATIANQLGLASKPFEVQHLSPDATFYVLASYHDGTNVYDPAQTALFLIDQNGNVHKKFFVNEHYSQMSDTTTVNWHTTPNMYEIDTDKFYTVAIRTANELFDPANSGLHIGDLLGLTLDLTSTTIYNQPSLNVRDQNFVVNGPGVLLYNPSNPVAMTTLGFNLYPSVITAAAGAGGLPTNGVHLLTAIYEWSDSSGNLYRSTTATPVSHTVAGNARIVVTVPTLRLTNKEDLAIIISVYATAVTGTIYYRAISAYNDITVDTLNLTINIADATLITRDTLYTTGGVLNNVSPPTMHSMTVLGDKVLGVPETNRVRIWESKPLASTIGVEFSDSLITHIEDGGDIVAIQVMDGKCFVFKEKAIYYFNGNGANSLGIGSYSQAYLLTSDVGLNSPKNITLIEDGIIFVDSGGPHLLARDHTIHYIGKPLTNNSVFKAESVLGVISHPERNLVHFIVGANSYVWDTIHKSWYKFVYPGSYGKIATVHNKLLYYSDSDIDILKEDTSLGNFTDNASAITMIVETPWIKTGGIVGHQKVNSIIILGEWRGSHTLNVTIYTNYKNSPAAQTITIPLTSDLDPYIIRVLPEDAECISMKVKIFDSNQAGIAKESFRFTAIVFEVLPMDGVPKISDTQY